MYTGLFLPVLFSPIYTYIFAPSDIGPDSVVMKERQIWDIEVRPVHNLPADEGENKRG